MINITDNFLSNDNFKMLQDLYFKECTWKTYDVANGEGLQFVHEHNPIKFYSLLSILNLTTPLGIDRVIRAKCNMTFRKFDQHIEDYEWHTDIQRWDDGTAQTAILYINDNNGGTAFKSGEFIQSKANRLVVFPLDTEHAGVHTTDTDFRCVLNINYKLT